MSVPKPDYDILAERFRNLLGACIDDESDEWPECLVCKAWAPVDEFKHKPGCAVGAASDEERSS